MSWNCSNHLCLSSSRLSSSVLIASDELTRFNTRKLSSQYPKQRMIYHDSKRSTNICAYYGLKTPPYKLDALEPYMSQRTLELHWGGHHREYLEGLNKQLQKNDYFYGLPMEELIRYTYNNGNPMLEFNVAAQVWNHDFFWESMQPGGGNSPALGLMKQIAKDFGSFTNFREKFIQAVDTLVGSGWVWLVLKRDGRLTIVQTHNAITPIAWGDYPILCLDMWEHAYYLDYKDDKVKYANVFLDHLVSWNSVMGRLARAQAFVNITEPNIPSGYT